MSARTNLLRTAVFATAAASAVMQLQCHKAATADPAVTAVVSIPGVHPPVETIAFPPIETARHEEMAKRDPLGFLRYCLQAYLQRGIADYTCRFTTQQWVGRSLTPVQVSDVRFRAQPFSVDMTWVKNVGKARRALYVENKWRDAQGRPLAWFEPAGAVAKLFVARIKQPIHGRRARAASRRTLDQFGFCRTFELILRYTQRAHDDGTLRLEYMGHGEIGGRPTFVFERRLPYTGDEEPYPDALLRYHIDQQWLVPTACYSYADDRETKLLGSYVLTDVEFNVGLDDEDFDPDRIWY